MHTLTTNTTLLTLCQSDTFQPSNRHPQGLRQTHFNSKGNKMS